jgi:hypothetical protein
MNETELDDLLNAWKTPPVPPSLRERVQAEIAAKRGYSLKALLNRWRLLIPVTAVGAVVLLVAALSAFPAKIAPPPFTVDSEMVQNEPWFVSGPERGILTSYNDTATEVRLAWSAPGHPMEGLLWAAKLAFSDTVEEIKRSSILEPDREASQYAEVYTTVGETVVLEPRTTLLNAGCRPSGRPGRVVGQETILNYATIAAQYDFWHRRVTVWMAPELNCFALRAKVEKQQHDGTWMLVSEKNALKVTMNPR